MDKPGDIRTEIKPMEAGIGFPSDSCWACIELFYDNHWFSEASRNFFFTPGENQQRAEAWLRDEEAALRERTKGWFT